jgi:ribose transport system permease protein
MTAAPSPPTLPLPRSPGRPWLSFQKVQTASVLLLTVVLCIVSSLRTEGFFTWYNLVENLLTNVAYLGVVACGMTFVIIAGGFDLSVASIAVTSSVVTVLLLQVLAGAGAAAALPVALLATVLAGAIMGAANGLFVAYVGVNPFVVTLSTMLVFRGIAFIATRGGLSIQVPLSLQKSFEALYWGKLGSAAYPVPVPILVFVAVFLVTHYLLAYTRFGHYTYAVGGNENASWLAGINTRLVKLTGYVIVGLTSAVAALLYAAQSNTAQADSLKGMEFQVIAAVVVGGTPLVGGSGSMLRTLNGLLLLAVIENMLGQFNVQEQNRNIVRGVIILLVVIVDNLVRRRKGARG